MRPPKVKRFVIKGTNGNIEEFENAGPGRIFVGLDCPFCGDEVIGNLLSLYGSGKRCSCGAVVRPGWAKLDQELADAIDRRFAQGR